MRRSSLNHTALLLAVPALLSDGCAVIQGYVARDTERMLATAGFTMRPVDTPEGQETLRSISPHQVVSRTTDGNVVYMYADPDNCRCLYVGGRNEYSEYQRLILERETIQREAHRPGGAP